MAAAPLPAAAQTGLIAEQSSAPAAADNAAPLPDAVPVPKPKYIPPQSPRKPEAAPGANSAPAVTTGPEAAPGGGDNAAEAAQNAIAPQNAPIPTPAPPSGTQKIGLQDAQQLAQQLADRFSQIRTMMGDFVQFDPRGGMSTGSFYLQRPGKILFDYVNAPVRVICDGSTIAVNNRRLGSWNLYDLQKSPLNLLLADKINIANGRLLEFTQEPNAITLVLGDATGRAKIRMIFDAGTYDLKQWTMTDNGQDTTIQIMNTKTGVQFADNMFNINYYRYPKKR